jgi:GTPase
VAATLALVGRPNVGKSTLFNRLTGRRDALVADVPGLTRDRRYGRADLGAGIVTLIDTGGLVGAPDELSAALERQAERAIDEADLVLFLVDARDGPTALDEDILTRLRRSGRPVILVVNKIDGTSAEAALAEFARFGLEDVVAVSAAHGRGIETLCRSINARLAPPAGAGEAAPDAGDAGAPATAEAPPAVRFAIVGRPNVGKSTLANRLLGEERQVVLDRPGTTRDAIEIPFERDGRPYVLVDTAGVRRKGRVEETVEKFSVVKTLEAIEGAHVVLLVLDAREGVVDQDLHVLGYAADRGAGIVVVVNKWDGLTAEQRDRVRTDLDRRLGFVPWVSVVFVSALHGTGVGHLLEHIDHVHAAGTLDVSTTHLTNLLGDLVTAHPPPAVRGRPVKLRFAHKGGSHPPKIIVHGNQTSEIPASYVRYLENGFRSALSLDGTPVRIELRTGTNPYAGRRNKLTPRQAYRRKRMVRHHKKKSR